MNSKDSDIWEYARLNQFSIVTFDSDFYDISVINGHPPKIIWIRSGNLTTNQIAKLLIQNKTIDGEDYMFSHGYDKADRGRSKLLVHRVLWDDGQWPCVEEIK
jgi:predicted nuclease of predicted toxin-antitoxin system